MARRNLRYAPSHRMPPKRSGRAANRLPPPPLQCFFSPRIRRVIDDYLWRLNAVFRSQKLHPNLMLTTHLVLPTHNNWLFSSDKYLGEEEVTDSETESEAIQNNGKKHHYLWDGKIAGLLAGYQCDALIVLKHLEDLVKKQRLKENASPDVKALAKSLISLIQRLDRKKKKKWDCQLLLIEFGNITKTGIVKIIIEKGYPGIKRVRRLETPPPGPVGLGSGGDIAVDYVQERLKKLDLDSLDGRARVETLAKLAVGAVEEAYLNDEDTGDAITLVYPNISGEASWCEREYEIGSARVAIEERAISLNLEDFALV